MHGQLSSPKDTNSSSTLLLFHGFDIVSWPSKGSSLAIGFASIIGYSILSSLAMGMEPICGQASGAKRYNLFDLTMQKIYCRFS
ncbi:hypothetical protein CCACVL1_07691 [Corchorus capsularis]|uniref:Uncharacterized protein n=1 Tax=Corchorus capsularis TaxID=210143 RepID=A0A1R3J4C9_COCAP|nr:hypothetical protein CCACVL1_07691 [Corchorus capsularis]